LKSRLRKSSGTFIIPQKCTTTQYLGYTSSSCKFTILFGNEISVGFRWSALRSLASSYGRSGSKSIGPGIRTFSIRRKGRIYVPVCIEPSERLYFNTKLGRVRSDTNSKPRPAQRSPNPYPGESVGSFLLAVGPSGIPYSLTEPNAAMARIGTVTPTRSACYISYIVVLLDQREGSPIPRLNTRAIYHSFQRTIHD